MRHRRVMPWGQPAKLELEKLMVEPLTLEDLGIRPCFGVPSLGPGGLDIDDADMVRLSIAAFCL